jgi:hypothetical protein
MKPRIILVRENAETLSCSDCAGSLEGIDAFGSHEVPDYEPVRRVMNQVGEIYLALRRRFGDGILIDVVDPRNAIYLIPTLIGDFFRYRPPFRVFIRTLLFGISPASVIFNGRALHVGNLPTPDDLVQWVGNRLQGSGFHQP